MHFEIFVVHRPSHTRRQAFGLVVDEEATVETLFCGDVLEADKDARIEEDDVRIVEVVADTDVEVTRGVKEVVLDRDPGVLKVRWSRKLMMLRLWKESRRSRLKHSKIE